MISEREVNVLYIINPSDGEVVEEILNPNKLGLNEWRIQIEKNGYKTKYVRLKNKEPLDDLLSSELPRNRVSIPTLGPEDQTPVPIEPNSEEGTEYQWTKLGCKTCQSETLHRRGDDFALWMCNDCWTARN